MVCISPDRKKCLSSGLVEELKKKKIRKERKEKRGRKREKGRDRVRESQEFLVHITDLSLHSSPSRVRTRRTLLSSIKFPQREVALAVWGRRLPKVVKVVKSMKSQQGLRGAIPEVSPLGTKAHRSGITLPARHIAEGKNRTSTGDPGETLWWQGKWCLGDWNTEGGQADQSRTRGQRYSKGKIKV